MPIEYKYIKCSGLEGAINKIIYAKTGRRAFSVHSGSGADAELRSSMETGK